MTIVYKVGLKTGDNVQTVLYLYKIKLIKGTNMMDEIIETIENGNRKHALLMLQESHYCFIDLVTKLQGMGEFSEVVRMMNTAYTIGYLNEVVLSEKKFR